MARDYHLGPGRKAVNVAMETNRIALLERVLHWYPHLTQIESAIGREI